MTHSLQFKTLGRAFFLFLLLPLLFACQGPEFGRAPIEVTLTTLAQFNGNAPGSELAADAYILDYDKWNELDCNANFEEINALRLSSGTAGLAPLVKELALKLAAYRLKTGKTPTTKKLGRRVYMYVAILGDRAEFMQFNPKQIQTLKLDLGN